MADVTLTVRNWGKFQQYRDRNPPWIKLHRSLLDDREWGDLSGDDAKVLVELWLIAASEGKSGAITTDVPNLAWRMRLDEDVLIRSIESLLEAGFLETGGGAAAPVEWASRYIPKVMKEEVLARDLGKCKACGSKKHIEFDHIVPVSQGGKSETQNLQLLCRSCNRKKRVRSTSYADRSNGYDDVRSKLYAEAQPAYPETEGETEKKKNPSGSKKASFPNGWTPNPSHTVKAQALELDVASEAAAFEDYHVAKGNRFVDWDRAFSTWLRNAESFRRRNGKPALGVTERDRQRIAALGY